MIILYTSFFAFSFFPFCVSSNVSFLFVSCFILFSLQFVPLVSSFVRLFVRFCAKYLCLEILYYCSCAIFMFECSVICRDDGALSSGLYVHVSLYLVRRLSISSCLLQPLYNISSYCSSTTSSP